MINPKRYKDLLIVSCEGKIMYTDFSNLSFMKLKGVSLHGKMLEEVFCNIDDEHPILLAATKGIANKDFCVEIETCTGKTFTKSGCVYPIYKEGRPIAAVEFSDIRYGIKDIRDIETSSDNTRYRDNGTVYTIDNIVTENSEMIDLKKEIEKIALTDFPILIYGETGTGKELVAQAIHNCSRRFSKSFVSVNCGTIPENLAESMLFGTVKGSFTDSENKAGLFENAEGGTLFLDEINSLPMTIQVKLLRAVEMKVIRRIGDTQERKVDVRIISATNEEPGKLLMQKKMLTDFYHRIAAYSLYLPGLKNRGNDVIVLANYYINYFNHMMNTQISPLNDEITEFFREYSWPGNVRELRNVIEGTFAFTENTEIVVEDIPLYIMESIKSKKSEKHFATSNMSDQTRLEQQMNMVESGIIDAAMIESGSKLSEAASLLGISKQLLRYKIGKHKRTEEIE